MVNRRQIIANLVNGRSKTAIFALTTACNCKCRMCNMHEQAPQSIALDDAKTCLAFLRAHGFLIAYFTGGEPTLHPHIVEIVRYANELGLITSITTNGTMPPARLRALADAGLYMLSVSLDHYRPEVCEAIRGYPGIFAQEVATIRAAQELGLKVYALTYLNRWLLEDPAELDRLLTFVNDELGVPFGFCYPTQTENTSYRLGGVETFDADAQLTATLRRLLQRKRDHARIANPVSYIRDAIQFNAGKEVTYPCKGGKELIYLDWNGDVYPCFIKPKLFNALRDDPVFLDDVACNECLINCFREPSILCQLFSSRHVLHELENLVVYGSPLALYL